VPRIPYLQASEASGEIARLLEVAPMNLVRLIALAEGVAQPTLDMAGAMLTKTALDPRLREYAILFVARRTEAEYEWVQHVPVAEAVGITPEEIAAIERDDLGAACFAEDAAATLAFTAELLEGPRPADSTFERLLAAGYQSREVVELVLIVGCYQLLAHVMTALDIDLDPPIGPAKLASTMDAIKG
jgi:alkylhydroperoxidase family enzyme